MSTPCLMLFTSRSEARILREGGSGDWVLDTARARRCRYAVCIQNLRDNPGIPDERAVPHGAAFLLGEIIDVIPFDLQSKPPRWLVKFVRYASVEIEGVWDGQRNPVGYTTMEALGINPSSFEFQPMPDQDGARRSMPSSPRVTEDLESVGPLTLAQAKRGLAEYLGVAESAIEIVVRA